MSDVLGWCTIVLILSVPPVFVAVAVTSRRKQRAGHRDAPSSGGLLGFDELFHPSAHDARMQWEAEQEIPAPAPTPDTGPGVIRDDGRITIEVPRSAAPPNGTPS